MKFWSTPALFVGISLGVAIPNVYAQTDPETGPATLEERACRGDLDAQTQLGEALINGHGRRKDVAAGLEWIRSGAESAHPPALRLLADIFAAGALVRRDDALALQLYGAAAERGDRDAQTELVSRFLLNRPRNFVARAVSKHH
jgi:TPR repeat protein